MIASYSPRTIVVMAGLLLTSPVIGFAGSPERHSINDLLFTVETVSSPTIGKVYAILRDRRGFMWFGTTNGLYLYDGYDPRIVAIPRSKHGMERYISGIVEWSADSLVLATWNGLWMLDVTTERVVPFLDSVQFGDGRIGAVGRDAEGKLWIGTRTGGVFCYDRRSGEIRSYTKKDGLSSDIVLSLLIDRSGRVWIGTLDGLNCFNPASGTISQVRFTVHSGGTAEANEVAALDEIGGELWVGTRNGLNRLSLSSGIIHHELLVRGIQNDIWAIAHDPAGRVWVSLAGAGLFLSMNSHFTQVTSSIGGQVNSIDSYIDVLYVDPSADPRHLTLWVGTRGAGVEQLQVRRNAFGNFFRGRNLPIRGNGAVLSLYQDRDRILWVGLWGGGLDALKETRGGYSLVVHYEHNAQDPAGLPDNTVNSVLQDSRGALWVGTGDGLGLLARGKRHFDVFRHDSHDTSSIADNDINRIREDGSGRIWICSEDGLSEVIRGAPIRFRSWLNRPQGAPARGRAPGGNSVSDIVVDSTGRLWVSTYGGGLIRIDADGRCTRFRIPSDRNGMEENWIHGIRKGRDGILWLATSAGLVRFDPRTGVCASIPSADLQGAYIFGLMEDDRGGLWVSSGIGLLRLDPEGRSFNRYGEAEGLAFNEFRSDFARTADGRFMVGGLDGFAVFTPDSLIGENRAPQVVLTSFSIFDRRVPAGMLSRSDIRLSYDQNFFSFSFAALDYTDPGSNSFVFRMVGVDPDWVDAGHRNYVSYTDIPPGAYTFEVKGANSSGVWNDKGAAIRLIIAPPYWDTLWFKLGAILVFAGLVYGAYRFRVGKLLELERLRLRIANDLHDDVGSNLSAIAMVSRSLRHAPGATQTTKRKLAEIYETAVATSEGLRDLVWFIKPENDTLHDLFIRMKDTAAMLLGDILVEFHFPTDSGSRRIAIDVKRNVFLAFKEIVTNIAKHAGADRVEVRFTLQDGGFEMVVADNGKGFEANTASRGHGLQSLRGRALGVSGTCEVTSRCGSGTSVRFSGKL